MSTPSAHEEQIRKWTYDAIRSQAVVDMHTHLYPPAFGMPTPNRSGKAEQARSHLETSVHRAFADQ